MLLKKAVILLIHISFLNIYIRSIISYLCQITSSSQDRFGNIDVKLLADQSGDILSTLSTVTHLYISHYTVPFIVSMSFNIIYIVASLQSGVGV